MEATHRFPPLLVILLRRFLVWNQETLPLPSPRGLHLLNLSLIAPTFSLIFCSVHPSNIRRPPKLAHPLLGTLARIISGPHRRLLFICKPQLLHWIQWLTASSILLPFCLEGLIESMLKEESPCSGSAWSCKAAQQRPHYRHHRPPPS